MCRPADGLDPPHLHRRLGLRGLRWGEPAVLSDAQQLQELLGLSDEELIRTLDASALELLSGELDHRPELRILLDLLAEAEERAGATMLHRWVWLKGPYGRPIDLLTARDFARFEDAVDALAQNGFILRLR